MNAKKFSHPFNILMALVLLLSMLGLSVGKAQAATCTQYHTVKRGEYLVQIARMYDTTWRELAELNNLKNPSVIFAGNRLCVSTTGAVIPNTGSSDQNDDDPTFDIDRVREDDEVTISAANFGDREDIDIFMGEFGADEEDGIEVDSVTSDRNGNFEVTLDIPSDLRGEDRIAIWLDSDDSSKFAKGWFRNRTSNNPESGPILPDLNDEDAEVAVQQVFFERAADIFKGNGGFYMPSSNYTAWAWVLRFEPDLSTAQRGLEFATDLLEVRMLDADGDPFERVFGINYVYFNLNSMTRNAFEDGDLDIYTYNKDEGKWTPCEVQVLIETKNRPYGRLSCVIEDFGLYGLAYH